MLILCPLSTLHILSTQAESANPFPIINKIGQFIGGLIPKISLAEGFKANPSNITIGINEKVTIQIQNYDLSTGELAAGKEKIQFFLADRYITFSYQDIGENLSGVWFVNFDPPTLYKSTPIKVTNATFSFTASPQADKPLQNTIIRITVADTWIVGNMWFPNSSFWPFFSRFTSVNNFGGFLSLTSPLSWFLGAFFAGYGRMSGKIDTTYHSIDVLVNVKPYHRAKIEALPPEKLTPNEVTSIPVLVENQGNYNDTFSFRISSESGYPLVLTDNGTITLEPGEQGQALVGVAVPANILDTGTLHSLMIEVYSGDQPNITIGRQRIFIESQGFYVSEENGVYSAGAGILFIFVIFILFYWRRNYLVNTGVKPQKPWKISEEQQHLAELKRTDKKAYEHERSMMDDEYKSAVLWLKEYRKSQRTTPIVKKSLQKQKEKPKKKEPAIVQKPVKKPKEQTKQSVILPQDTQKEKALAKIRREQEKQLRRMK